MSDHLVFLLLGLANGAVFASLALALVVTYRSSGVVNFATSAIALYGSYGFAFFRQGEFLVLIPGLPAKVDLGWEFPLPLAIVASLAMTAILGLLIYGLVFRPLRKAPAVAKAVASVGVLVVMTGIMGIRLGTRPVAVDDVFPSDIWTVGGVRVASDRIWFALTVVLVAVLLWALFRFTPFGLATRAAAETERGAYLAGLSPDRLAALNWMLSAAVAGGAGILIAPIVPLVPVAYSLFIIPALAAAILGRFQYMIPAVVGGLAIGMLQSDMQFLVASHDWLPGSGMPELIPLALILIVLVVRAAPLPGRGAVVQQTLGSAPRPVRRVNGLGVVGIVGAVAGLVLLDGSWRTALIMTFIFSMLSLSYVVVTGYAGQVSLAQLTLAGSAGFLLGPLAADLGLPFPVAPLVAALGATVIGVVVGLPALRIRGLPVAVVTLALALVLEKMWFANSDYVGAAGVEIEKPSLFGLDLSSGTGVDFPRLEFGVMVFVALILVAFAVSFLRTSRLGSEMLAVRANERSAAAAGVSVVRVKVLAFAIGSFIAGLGGTMFGYRLGSVTFDSFTVLLGLSMLATSYIIGITSVTGGLLAGFGAIGGLGAQAMETWFGGADYFETIIGVLLIIGIIRNPEGVVGYFMGRVEQYRASAGRAAPDEVLTGDGTTTDIEPRDGAPLRLELHNVTVRYGGVTAVDDVSFAVEAGTVVGLIGPNGAGKTTLIDAITGFAPSSGSVVLSDEPLDDLRPHERVHRGLGRTFQAIELYDDLSVRENVVVGQAAARARGDEPPEVEAVLANLGLASAADRSAGELSQGQRQLVSMARALVGSPGVLLLDEPAGGLDSTESIWLGERIRAIADSGVAVLLIDHDMHLMLGLCDVIQVLNFGSLISSGTPDEIRSDPAVASAYLGETHATLTEEGGEHASLVEGGEQTTLAEEGGEQ
ncbi:MAG: branched-chain amino acid ABC transporter permease/ATP-binding protein [bacterium]|nr:branched-chain amino acid ABC transporter permease/ATP-binding protein [bacterium]